jgi:hypothetical protein
MPVPEIDKIIRGSVGGFDTFTAWILMTSLQISNGMRQVQPYSLGK